MEHEQHIHKLQCNLCPVDAHQLKKKKKKCVRLLLKVKNTVEIHGSTAFKLVI